MQHIGESCFLFTLKVCFLTGVFRPTMFKLILGNWINIYLIFTVFYSLPLFLVSSVIFQSILTFLVLMQHLSYSIFSLLFSSGQLHSHVWPFAIPWTAAHQASLSITISQSLLKLLFIESVMLSNHLIVLSSSCLQSFPVSGSFPMSWLFISSGQSIGALASVLPVSIQGWFPLGLTGLIFLLSKGLSRVFSSTTIQKHQFFITQPSLLKVYWELFTYNDI